MSQAPGRLLLYQTKVVFEDLLQVVNEAMGRVNTSHSATMDQQ